MKRIYIYILSTTTTRVLKNKPCIALEFTNIEITQIIVLFGKRTHHAAQCIVAERQFKPMHVYCTGAYLHMQRSNSYNVLYN